MSMSMYYNYSAIHLFYLHVSFFVFIYIYFYFYEPMFMNLTYVNVYDTVWLVLEHQASMSRSLKSQLVPGVLDMHDVVPRATAAPVCLQRQLVSMYLSVMLVLLMSIMLLLCCYYVVVVMVDIRILGLC